MYVSALAFLLDGPVDGCGRLGIRGAYWVGVHSERWGLTGLGLTGLGLTRSSLGGGRGFWGGGLLRRQCEHRSGKKDPEYSVIAKAHSSRCEHGQ